MNETYYLEQALKKIDKYYYEVTGKNSHGANYIQSAENAFTAELYHQLKCIQRKYSKDELVWHFDLNKMRANNIRPDLVLHKSADTRDDQRIYIEVKTNCNTTDIRIRKDLRKILNAVTEENNKVFSEKLGFKHGFFIVGNIDFNQFKNCCQYVFNKVDSNIINKVHIFHFNSNNYKPTKYKLAEIINKKPCPTYPQY